jgi:hypothetical protein
MFFMLFLILLILFCALFRWNEHKKKVSYEYFAEEQCVDENNQIQTIEVPVPEKKAKKKDKRELFLIYNKYNYQEAREVCKMYKGRLATKQDLNDAFNRGANWCSWGWLEGQAVGYPVQEKYWMAIDKSHKGFCGPTAGLNVMESVDPLKKYYVTCFGLKPKQSHKDVKLNKDLHKVVVGATSLLQDIAQCKKAKEVSVQKTWAQQQKQQIRILKFNPTEWSLTAAATTEETEGEGQKNKTKNSKNSKKSKKSKNTSWF